MGKKLAWKPYSKKGARKKKLILLLLSSRKKGCVWYWRKIRVRRQLRTPVSKRWWSFVEGGKPYHYRSRRLNVALGGGPPIPDKLPQSKLTPRKVRFSSGTVAESGGKGACMNCGARSQSKPCSRLLLRGGFSAGFPEKNIPDLICNQGEEKRIDIA